ncbi:CesT family type III secretion system chaperone [Endozoicomonas ascidiicola]|uniref:CesT family type III secretion system chaperone n=1 Tax=Endozoicomonas ascidiicola TaxID=1698521 RepID=UPI0008366E13|nr:CesT family type III secretion system chaperone [Endozoicomonas ascidiicola]
MGFDQLMKDFAARQQLEELEPQNNRYTMTIDKNMEVSCFQANGRVYLYGALQELPLDIQKREELIKKLLERNLMLMASERVSLCIDDEINVLALYSSSPVNGLSLGLLEDQFSEFTNNYELYKNVIGGNRQPPPSTAMMLMP